MPQKGPSTPNEGQPKPEASPPIPPNCRAETLHGTTMMAQCLTPEVFCDFRFPYGYSYYCRHPLHAQIVARAHRAN